MSQVTTRGEGSPRAGTRVEAEANDSTGLLIIRTWVEPGSSEPFRAQIRVSTDVSGGFDRSLTVTQPSAVVATLEGWLVEILSDAKLCS